MRKRLIIHCSILLGLLFCSMGKATTYVNWNAGATVNNDVVANLDDVQIDINGNAANNPVVIGDDAGGGILVHAQNEDVVINVNNFDSFLVGKNTGASELYLRADSGRTINLYVDENLAFKGSDDAAKAPLLVTFGGSGLLNIYLDNDKKLSFTNDATRGGARFFVRMQEGWVNVHRKTAPSDDDVTLEVGPESLISYLGQTVIPGPPVPVDTQVGHLSFFPGNADVDPGGTGRMILKVQDTGGVYVGGNYVNTANDRITWANIDMTQLAGHRADFQVYGATALNYAGLLILNYNKTYSHLYINQWNLETNPFDGTRYGFILGPNGLLKTLSEAYLDYVGLANNICVELDLPDEILMGRAVDSLTKPRNPSALFVDGIAGQTNFIAQMVMEGASGIYYRSGVGSNGVFNDNVHDEHPFTVDTLYRTPGEGEFVLDVEAPLEVQGLPLFGGAFDNAMQILSLEVAPFGPNGFVIDSITRINFPSRTFKVNGDTYYAYNKAAFLVNNRINFRDTWLVHTDSNHKVCENNDVATEPTYVGGDTLNFQPFADGFIGPVVRPKMAFYDSQFDVHTSVGVTGVDLWVPDRFNTVPVGPPAPASNESIFTFYGNGYDAYMGKYYQIDNGSGRNMILGTRNIACDGCTNIGNGGTDAHLDVKQEFVVAPAPVGLNPHELLLKSACNDIKIHEEIGVDSQCTGTCGAEPSIHTIYLGNSSNVSVGTYVSGLGVDNLATDPKLKIDGNFFSFETQGGPVGNPAMSGITGKGGIFVDSGASSAEFLIDKCYSANISTMVTKSGNGVISLPKSQVFFDKMVGISDWQLNLTNNGYLKPIVAEGQVLSDYTLYWIEVIKDYDTFCPYIVGGSTDNCCCCNCTSDCCTTPTGCQCPAVTQKNVQGMPTIKGTVEQLQISGSRLDNPASLLIDGGKVGELIFMSGCNSAEAPTARIVLKNGGVAGLGSTHKDTDALCGSVFLGVGGIVIIADGADQKGVSGQVLLNEDIIIQNTCHILKGPNFGETARNSLKFYSDVPREIVVPEGGSLNLSTFADHNDTVIIGGKITLVLKEDSSVILGGGIVKFTDDATVRVDSVVTPTSGTEITSLDDVRVKFMGEGIVEFDDNSRMLIQKKAYVGVESNACVPVTDLEFVLKDKAQFKIGGNELEGGSFQVGNTTVVDGGDVQFKLEINGADPKFEVGSRSFLGLNIGMASNSTDPSAVAAPDEWLVGPLQNVTRVDIDVPSGTFSHGSTYIGSDPNASLLAIQDSGEVGGTIYTFTHDATYASILGGGNIALIDPSVTTLNPIVGDVDGETIPGELSVGIMSSKMFLADIFGIHKTIGGATGSDLYTYLQVVDNTNEECYNILATAEPGLKNQAILGYVDGGFIAREGTEGAEPTILGKSGTMTDFGHSFELGAVGVRLNSQGDPAVYPRTVKYAFEMP